jgi:gamma-glutamylcyclotransferase (GGCT)/AIG2-like uncharacterized protein YtfP
MLYFAYGANLNFSNFWERCPNAIYVGIDKLNGYRFFIDNYGVASIQKDPRTFVQGILWEITEKDEIALDKFEGVKDGYYRKEYLMIPSFGEALVYISNTRKTGDPKSSYFQDIIRQAESLEFDEKYLFYLKGLYNG